MKLAFATLAVTLSFAPVVLIAQTSTTTTTADPTKPATIGQRQENQQDRIAQGVKSGQLTAGETAHLETQEAGINKEKAGMRAQDNGKLTGQDKKTLNHQLNQESRRIYRDKHNGRKQ